MSHFASFMVKHVTHTGDTQMLRTVDNVKWLREQKKKGIKVQRDGRQLTSSEKGILTQIADDHNEDRCCAWPSIPNLAERVPLSEQQCRRLVHQLQKDGMLESRPRLRDRDEGRTSNEYRFWFDPPFDRASTRDTEKRIELQSQRAAQRPKQMSLTPLPSTVGAPLSPAAVPPSHGREGPPITGGSPPLPSTAVAPLSPAIGLELLLEKPEEPLGEQPKETTPLPPVTGGADLILPGESVTFDDANFGLSCGIAARWVMAELGITKTRIEAVVTAALRLYCQQRRSASLQDAARVAVDNYRLYIADLELMRFGPWAPAKFFGEGWWANQQGWPYDQEKVRRARESRAGWRPS